MLLGLDLLLIWMFNGTFWSTENLAFMLPLLIIVLGAATFQLFRLSKDGPAVAKLMGGTHVNASPGAPDLRRFRNVAEEIAIAANLTCPELFVLESEPRINAFAAGSMPSKTAVCVSRGALEKLSREELQGVVAHEIAHLRHDDVRLSVRLSATLFGLMAVVIAGVFLLQVAAVRDDRRKTRKEREDEKSSEAFFMASGFFLVIAGGLGWLVAAILDAKISRQQELRADAEAVRLMTSPAGLVGALVKLFDESNMTGGSPSERSGALNPLFFRGSVKQYWFDSHPPLLDRIRALDPQRALELQGTRR